MRKLNVSIQKELVLLFRDKTGLVLLFIMPALLVFVITLIQENVLKTNIQMLFVDNDNGSIGQDIEKFLNHTKSITLIKKINGSVLSAKEANKAVADGLFQFCVIIPEGLTDAVKKTSLQSVKNALLKKNNNVTIKTPAITLYFDPTTQGGFKVAISNILNNTIRQIEQKLKLTYTLDLLPEEIKTYLSENIDLFYSNSLESNDPKIINLNEKFATKMGFKTQPTSVQQNVPAWTLFGIFFIVVPIAGSLINERESGTLLRLKAMPVSYFVIITGKIISYTLVCFGQFGIILFIGKFIFPLFGSPAFDAGSQHIAFFLILLSSIFAATGYGILLGTLLKSYQQASMFGPVSIVIAAAIGGILIPVYTMPDFIQPFSILSPLSWAQNAFYDILLRGGGLISVLPEIFMLFTFFGVNLFIACFFLFNRDQSIK